MIIGIGSDIIRIGRIEAALKRPRFVSRFFSEAEVHLFSQRPRPAQTIAAHYAMKEAVAKAIGTGVRGFDLRDISIERDRLGKPILNAMGRLPSVLEALGIDLVHLSCAHDGDYAIGYAMAEKLSNEIRGQS